MRTLQSFTIDEKVRAFDHLYRLATEYFEDQTNKETYREDSDSGHYLFEEVMLRCLGENVWEEFNALQKEMWAKK